ncbi:hemolysin family protein [Parenemella sanctibonifatiensis]|uniref:HlyC/CorC family transporter n=1 Tax=Parenemella sanctibonifatiensis TaxID=2016505 RepID=A0A255E1K6_9ACTN|nr:hemolysin family protein [Parenemella sanctibonifatiensis]OYN85424.1 hypothetical protein CGZ92_10545 [Parenemella sanctibonifatiensis]OYN92028.1 hypothetical protein CGZ91_00405 [Parenemella sanctibonifatiensis]
MLTAVLLLLLGLVLVSLIIAANGYFVLQEFAYMSVDRVALRSQADAGDDAAARALKVTQQTSFMLSGAQLGITVTGLLVGFVAEPLIGSAISSLLGGVGVPAAVGVSIGTVGALVLATVVQMIFGELYPKNLAIANPNPLARSLARSTLIYLTVFGWLITVFDKASTGLLKLVGVEPVHDVDSSASATDLEHIIDDSRASGDLPEELSLMLERIIEFPDQPVVHAMIPRVQVDTVREHHTIAETRRMMAAAHTRYPVIGDHDEPIGVVHLLDVLATEIDDPRPVTEIMREPILVPTLMSLGDALRQLSDTHNELACVIDEYGGFAGIITIEDFAEELVGEISDEHDDSGPEANSEAEGVWVMDGDLHIDEAERSLGTPLPEGDFETIAGLVISHTGRFPEVGEKLTIELPSRADDHIAEVPQQRQLGVEILAVERHIPTTVRLSVLVAPLESDSEEVRR